MRTEENTASKSSQLTVARTGPCSAGKRRVAWFYVPWYLGMFARRALGEELHTTYLLILNMYKVARVQDW